MPRSFTDDARRRPRESARSLRLLYSLQHRSARNSTRKPCHQTAAAPLSVELSLPSKGTRLWLGLSGKHVMAAAAQLPTLPCASHSILPASPLSAASHTLAHGLRSTRALRPQSTRREGARGRRRENTVHASMPRCSMHGTLLPLLLALAAAPFASANRGVNADYKMPALQHDPISAAEAARLGRELRPFVPEWPSSGGCVGLGRLALQGGPGWSGACRKGDASCRRERRRASQLGQSTGRSKGGTG